MPLAGGLHVFIHETVRLNTSYWPGACHDDAGNIQTAFKPFIQTQVAATPVVMPSKREVVIKNVGHKAPRLVDAESLQIAWTALCCRHSAD